MNSNIIVDTPYDMRFDVTMNGKRMVSLAGGMGGIPPQSLLDLYRQSDLVAIAHVGRSVVAGTDDELKTMLIKTDLHIFSQLKGENSQQVIPYYYSVWGVDPDMFKPAPGFVEKFHHIMRSVWGPNPGTFKQGESLLVFLEHRESKDGKRLGGYKATGWGISSIKKLDDEALAIYRHRIEDLALILLRGAPNPAELVEWLVRCVEESATREEGIRKLSGILSLPSIQRERESAAESSPTDVDEPADQSEGDVEDPSEQSPGADIPESEKENLKLAAALTQDHKTRLANALFAISDLSEADMNLVSLVQKLDDGRFAPYLVSQLHRIADRAPRFAESLVWRIAEVTNDGDLKQLANDYDDAAEYDKSEDERESGQQDSTRNQRTDGVTIAAIKRSARLKDFLKLVEYKTKL